MVGEPGVWWGQPGGQTQLENLLLEQNGLQWQTETETENGSYQNVEE